MTSALSRMTAATPRHQAVSTAPCGSSPVRGAVHLSHAATVRRRMAEDATAHMTAAELYSFLMDAARNLPTATQDKLANEIGLQAHMMGREET